MNLNIVNNLILAEAASNSYWGWVWLCALLFFALGFIVGAIIWRNLLGNAFTFEEDNRRMAAAFKKREQAYLDNRKNASSILGQQDNDVRDIRR